MFIQNGGKFEIYFKASLANQNPYKLNQPITCRSKEGQPVSSAGSGHFTRVGRNVYGNMCAKNFLKIFKTLTSINEYLQVSFSCRLIIICRLKKLVLTPAVLGNLVFLWFNSLSTFHCTWSGLHSVCFPVKQKRKTFKKQTKTNRRTRIRYIFNGQNYCDPNDSNNVTFRV